MFEKELKAMEEKKEIYPGIFIVERPDSTNLLVGKDWSTHIHLIPGHDPVIKIEKTGEHIPGKINPLGLDPFK
jgi:hypothetical protein